MITHELMLVSILFWIFAALITRRAFRLGKKVSHRGFWLNIIGLSVALGLFSIAGAAVKDSRLSSEELAAHGLQRCVGFFILVLPLAVVGWTIGRMTRPRLTTPSPVVDQADGNSEKRKDSPLENSAKPPSKPQIIPIRPSANPTRFNAPDRTEARPEESAPPPLYWVTHNQTQIGPIPHSEVLRQIDEEKLSHDDFCWNHEMSDWTRIGDAFQADQVTRKTTPPSEG